MGAGMVELFDALCLRWVREADVLYQQTGAVPPTLVVLPRDAAADEVAIRVDGLRGNLVTYGPAVAEELRPAVAPHDPAGLVFLTTVRDDVAVYVTLGADPFRRALGLRVVPGTPPSLARADTDPAAESFRWLDALLPGGQPGQDSGPSQQGVM